MDSGAQLTDEQGNKLASFKEITQYDDNDQEKIMSLLNNCEWNLEMAIQRFFDNNFTFEHVATPSSTNLPPPNTSASSGVSRLNQYDDVMLSQFDLLPKFPKANRLAGNWKFSPGIKIADHSSSAKSGNSTNGNPLFLLLIFVLLLIPKTFLFVLIKLNEVLRSLFPTLYDLWKPDSNSFPTSPLYLPLDSDLATRSTEKLLSPDLMKDLSVHRNFNFKTYLEETTKDVVNLPIFEGEFNDAYDICKAELKFLIVILIDDSKLSNLFLKHVIYSSDFKALVNDKYADRPDNFIIWGGHTNYLEGFSVGKTYKVSRLPYIGLVSNVSTYGETYPTMSLMKYSQSLNFEDINDDKISVIKSKLKRIFKLFRRMAEQYVIQLIDQKIDQDQKNFERLIKQQQDEAYSRSLEQDRIKKQKSNLLKEIKNLKKEKFLAKLQVKQSFLNMLKTSLVQWQNVLLNEDKQNDPVALDGSKLEKDQVCLMQFRLPKGERFVKKLSKDCSLAEVYLFVQLKLLLKEIVANGDYNTEKDVFDCLIKSDLPHGSQKTGFEFKFELSSLFPKFKVPVENQIKIKDTKQLLPNCNLLVEYDLDYQDQLDFLKENFTNNSPKKLTIEDVNDEDIEDISSDEEDEAC